MIITNALVEINGRELQAYYNVVIKYQYNTFVSNDYNMGHCDVHLYRLDKYSSDDFSLYNVRVNVIRDNSNVSSKVIYKVVMDQLLGF